MPKHREPFHLSSPRRIQHTSRLQPDRLSPQSQFLFRRYKSTLPTSLIYIILTTRGCSPWRPAADMGTASHENHTHSRRFSRADRKTGNTTRAVVLYGGNIRISGQTASTDSRTPYKEKTTLLPLSADVSAFVYVTVLVAETTISVSRFRNINRIPFREIYSASQKHMFVSIWIKPAFENSFR
jgi:hypothetical protein